VFRADAAFAKPEIYQALEECGVKYAIRLPANDSLLRDIEELLTRPVGRPSTQTRGVVHGFSPSGGQLEDGTTGGGESGIPCRGVVSARGLDGSQSGPAGPGGGAVLQPSGHGGAVRKGKQAVKMTRLSCHRFRSNEVQLALSLLA
jgi:hypothetical protein